MGYHGRPEQVNCHPQRSDPEDQFVVVHNGIITNFRELEDSLINKVINSKVIPILSVLLNSYLHLYNTNLCKMGA
ncbi:CFC_HP_G0007390.mRNA.1.CDS.1 [Saccharomyces cerevisiae]|nr:CFC_HP_G0007390.mRNA.1.CDS.1 [Saccharomyces cerevisiae]CAI6924168.1 CFC_HP_G0007390.mRNA.1.CDS.1 [Saccharomyces cerevisiae]